MSNTIPREFSDRELLFGAAFAQLIMRDQVLVVWERPELENMLFEFKSKICSSVVLFKYSTKKKFPWQFSISKEHVDIIQSIKSRSELENRYVALICNLDGVCLINVNEIKSILPDEYSQASISVSRPPKSSYLVSGPNKNKLKTTIARSRWTIDIVGR